MADRTAAERQRRQVQRDRGAGIARVMVKVPKDRAPEIREIAATMRQEAQQQQEQQT